MKRIELLKESVSHCSTILANEPDIFPLKSIIEQINYLINLEEGSSSDLSMLKKIKIGWIAARELDGFPDKELINKLHLVSREVEKIKQERGISDDKTNN